VIKIFLLQHVCFCASGEALYSAIISPAFPTAESAARELRAVFLKEEARDKGQMFLPSEICKRLHNICLRVVFEPWISWFNTW